MYTIAFLFVGFIVGFFTAAILASSGISCLEEEHLKHLKNLNKGENNE